MNASRTADTRSSRTFFVNLPIVVTVDFVQLELAGLLFQNVEVDVGTWSGAPAYRLFSGYARPWTIR